MKVLMFGWEFPPHISGGLGTACHGLTEALISNGVDILFVVPTLKGGESLQNGSIISASEVIVPDEELGGIPKRKEIHRRRKKARSTDGSNNNEEQVVTVTLGERPSSIEYLNVPSPLMPYQTATVNEIQQVSRWNHSFQEEYTVSKIYRSADTSAE